MIRSMTTFAKVHKEGENWSVNMELRSVNSRFCDVIIRMPKWMAELEDKIRRKVKESLERGRVELSIQFEASDLEIAAFKPDIVTAKAYWEAANQIKQSLNMPGDLELAQLLRLCREAIRPTETDTDMEVVWNRLEPVLNALLDKAISMSIQEGEHLLSDLKKRLDSIEEKVEWIEKRSKEHTKIAQESLRARIKQMLEEFPLDENRVVTEAAFLADRLDITEEIVRAKSHINQFRKYLEQGGAIGRRLDFLLQELFREVNTMGSKSADQEISKAVVEIKGELEKIREQVQNIV